MMAMTFDTYLPAGPGQQKTGGAAKAPPVVVFILQTIADLAAGRSQLN
jgi:hypothetical protein